MFSADSKADTIGILSSIFCLIHCLLLPVLVLAGLLNEDWSTHAEWVDYLFIILAIGAVYFASRNAEYHSLKVLMWVGAGWFSVSIMLHEVFEAALYSSMIASVLLVIVHSINFKQHQQKYHARKATARA